MAVEFTVIDPGVRLFRCNLTNVSCDLDKNCGLQDLYFKGNFDNFRTFYSKTSSDPVLPEWMDFDTTWVYETGRSHVMGYKIFTITIMGTDLATGQQDAFVGEATVDLMTLATGPRDVTLLLKDGDISVGRVWFNMVMLEVAEMSVMMLDMTLQGIPSKYQSVLNSCRIRLTKRQHEDQIRESAPPAEGGDGWLTYRDLGDHHSFGCSVATVLEDEGFSVTLFEPGACGETVICTANIGFAQFIRPENRADIPADPTALDNEDEEIAHQGTGFDVPFTVPLLDYDGSATEGSVSGRLRIFGMPIYVQMYGGRTVDGVVCEGRPYPGSHPMPPFIHEDGLKEAAII